MGPRLPSASDLARLLGVSRPALLRAAGNLRAAGFLTFRHGQGMRLTLSGPRVPPSLPAKPDLPAERVLNTLRLRIRLGDYRSGEALPKREKLAQELGVSLPTVSKALARLAGEGGIHRQGRAWRAGRPRTAPSGRLAPPAILVLTRNNLSWSAMYESPRVRGFPGVFDNEALVHGVRLLNLSARPRHTYDVIHTDWPTTRDTLRRGNLPYLGALIAGTPEEVFGLENWVAQLSSLRKPVVWFDAHDQGARFVRPKGLIRCHFDEAGAARVAVEFLQGLGHTQAVYVSPLADDGWSRERWELMGRQWAANPEGGARLEACAHWQGPREAPVQRELENIFRILALKSLPTDPFLAVLRTSLPRAFAADGRLPSGSAACASLVRELWADIPWGQIQGPSGGAFGDNLSTLILICLPYFLRAFEAVRSHATVLVAANDHAAFRLYYWLRLLDVDIPGQVSLLSFDNSPQLRQVPISSVDFGFGGLGYMAFHALMGDVPVSKDRWGNVRAQPKVADRGSVLPLRRNHFKPGSNGKQGA